MPIKDFSITLKKINTSNSKKDVSVVTGYNAIAQYIEHIAKTQKGELTSDKNLGSDYFNYIFDGKGNIPVMEVKLAADITSKIPNITNVEVKVVSFTETTLQFEVFYTALNGINKQSRAGCFIEVDI